MEETQSFRVVGTADIENIDVDVVNGQNVIYWEDIDQVFPGARYIRNGSSVVKLLRDSNRVRIVPHCIKHYPGDVLDVVLSSTVEHAPIDSPVVTASLGLINGRGDAPTDAPITNSHISFLTNAPTDPSTDTRTGTPTDTQSDSQTNPYSSNAIIDVHHANPLSSSSAKGSGTSTTLTLAESVSSLSIATRTSAEPSLAKQFQSAVIHKLDVLHDLGAATQIIVKEVFELQKRMDDRLILIQSKTEAILAQNYELLEYTTPRLFIVLPETTTSWDPTTMFRTKFRLHFICECGEHTKTNGSKIPHHLHLANHEGYVINKPTEFFEKYGPFLVLMLQLLKTGMNIAGVVIPALSTLKVIDIPDSTKSCLDSVNSKVVEGVDYALAYLEYSRNKASTSDSSDADMKALEDDLGSYLAGIEGMEGVELRQLGTYLAANSSGNLLGNLYRMTTKDGHVKWVCRDHYRAGYQEKHTQKLRQVVEVSRGFFDEQLGRIEIVLHSSLAATEFYDAVSKAKGVLHLEVSLRWRQSYSDFVKLKEMVSNSNIRAIKLDLCCKTSPIINRIKVSTSRRYDPIFKIMQFPSIQSFAVERAPFDFFDQSTRLPKNASLSNLKHLRIDGPRIANGSGFKVIDFDEDCVAKLKSLVAQAPNLSRLSLTTSLRSLPEVFSSIAEHQAYPIVFENLMLRFLPPRTESSQPQATLESSRSRVLVETLDHLFKIYGAQLDLMDISSFTLQGLEYDGGDRRVAKEWLQIERNTAVVDLHLGEKCIKDLGIIIGPLNSVHGLVDGDIVAQFNLGVMYMSGESVPQDYSKAVKWYQKAASQEHAGAQYNLGFMYGDGKGVPQDYSKAVEWYQKAASQGHVGAQYNLGVMYMSGECVPQDYPKAVEWYQKAANQGHAGAQYNLGFMYKDGKGVPQDCSKAVEWCQKAASQGHADAQCSLGVMYENGNGVPQDYSKAVEWYQKAANQGHAGAQYNLGIMYENAKGVPQDYSKAVEWYQKAANQGAAIAQCNLGVMYENGKGVLQDYSKAVEWYQRAANQGAANQGAATAQYNLGVMYMKWYQKAASQGHAGAQYNLSVMYANDNGVPQDYSKAVEWYQKAASQGHADAQCSLGIMYANGNGVPQDYSKAVEWYQKAASQGHAGAQYNLSVMYANDNGVPQDYSKVVEWY
ncbi:hypothetical protein EDD11_008424 [Mortierella claussenii]|nr:hypothetical protein EDD11_008424 [Mortierella claussenii]